MYDELSESIDVEIEEQDYRGIREQIAFLHLVKTVK